MRRCWLIAILLLIVGCSKDIDFESSQDQAQNRILSGIIADEKDEDNESRVYLDNKIRIRWNKGDLISVFDGTTRNKEFAFLGADGSSAGDFEDNSAGTIGTGNAIDRLYGLYPYASSTEYCYGEDESEADYLRYTLPATQTYKPNSMGLNANLMVAATANKSDKTLVFRNVCSYLRLKLYGADQTVSSIVFKGNTDEVLTGDVAITATYGNAPTIKMLGAADEDNKTITLDCSEGVDIGNTSDEATEFWLVVPPVNFPNGFTITVKGEGNMGQEIVVNNNLTFARNTYNTITREVAMTEVSEPSTEIPDNEIWYTSSDGKVVTPNQTNAFGANIVSNTYENGKGVIKFDGAVTSIGEGAFYVCSSLTSIIIPNSVTSIGGGAFADCSSLTSITIPNSVTSIGDEAFCDCGFNSITIPNSVTSIGVQAFYGCSSLQKFYGKFAEDNGRCLVNDGVLFAYAEASGTEYTIPNSVTSIGNSAFYNCSSLTSITISNSVTSIGGSAFSGCSSLTSITIPNSVTSIGDRAFAYCSSLTEVTIGNGVTSIGNGAFMYCSSLTEVTIGNSVTSIGKSAFARCSSLTEINIPNSVTSIGDDAFYGCGFNSITIPNSVTSIGDNAFRSCKSLTEVTIGNGVTSIGFGAFGGCSSLSSITIPNSVTSIGNYAFEGCGFNSITIPNSVTSIGRGAFMYCSSLTSISIPNSVTSIGDQAFYGCSSLQNIFCKRTTPPAGGSYMFDRIHSSAKIYVPADSGEAYKTAQYWSDYASIIEEDLDRVEDPNPSSTSFKRRAMVMQFTGTDCPYCPYIIEALEQLAADAAYKDKFSWAAIHTFNPLSDPAAPSNSEDQQKLGSTFGVSGYPTVLVDIGTMVGNSNNNIALNLANLKNAVDNSVANAPSAGISAAMTLDENNRVVTARVSVKAKDSNIYRVSMWLLEDNIKGGQSGSSTITSHDHAVRYVARGTDGSVSYVGYELNDGKAMSAGQIADYVFTINIKDQTVKLANCKLIFFVTTSTGNSYTVVNSVVSTDLKTAIPFEYEN